MATIDYKEKYEQALERARQFSEKPYLEDSAGIVEYIFPELKESDDERIRKHLIAIVELYYGKTDEQEKKDCLAWLEKQDEQKPVEWSQVDLISLGYLADFVDKNGDAFYGKNKPNVVKWVRSFAELPTHEHINDIEQKSYWSEEDEQTFIKSVEALEDYGKFELADWLKEHKSQCLTPQSQWKPSERQKEALLWCVVHLGGADKQTLGELLEELNKL